MSNVTPNYPAINPNDFSVTSIKYVKPATADIMLDSEALPIELMTNLIFENIGGQELINIGRTDTLNGQNILYNPIANIKAVALRHNSMNMLPRSDSSEKIFKLFTILLEARTPPFEVAPPVVIDAITGDLVINLINVKDDEQVDVQIITDTTLFNDTIY